MIERHIDYLQFSALLSETEMLNDRFQHVPAPRFYKRGFSDENGLRYYFGNPNSKKCLIVASGQALHNMRCDGRNDQFIINWALEGQGTITRLDIAVTDWIEDSLVLVEDVQNWYEQGRVESNLSFAGGKAISSITRDEPSTLETFYIGSLKKRGKAGIFRAYDKGIELDLGKYLCTRLELEFRGDNAHNTAKRIAQSGDIAGNFRAKLNVKHNEFDRLMDAPIADISRGKAKDKDNEEDKMSKKWQWLTEKVAPVLKEAHSWDEKHNKGDDRMYWFLRASGFSHSQSTAILAIKEKE